MPLSYNLGSEVHKRREAVKIEKEEIDSAGPQGTEHLSMREGLNKYLANYSIWWLSALMDRGGPYPSKVENLTSF